MNLWILWISLWIKPLFTWISGGNLCIGVWKMVVQNEGQALCVAEEMEKRAIRMYERALMVADDPATADGIRELLAEEQTHLMRFREMKEEHPVLAAEERLIISSMAADVLFSGGVMEMKREHALTTLEGLYRYAAQSEAEAVEAYGGFASKCTDPKVQSAFMAIAREESQHLSVLLDKLAQSAKKVGK